MSSNRVKGFVCVSKGQLDKEVSTFGVVETSVGNEGRLQEGLWIGVRIGRKDKEGCPVLRGHVVRRESPQTVETEDGESPTAWARPSTSDTVLEPPWEVGSRPVFTGRSVASEMVVRAKQTPRLLTTECNS